MSFALDIRRFAEKAKDNADQVVRAVTVQVAQSVITKSPVDTGRFRGNWQFGVGVPDLSTTESVDPSGGATLSKLTAAIMASGIGVTYISNSLPYAIRLENGWSKQAPSGMVGVTAVEFQDYVHKAVGQLK